MTPGNTSGTFLSVVLFADMACSYGGNEPVMAITKKNIAIIAPDSLLSAFCILFRAAPNIDLLAAEASVTAIQNKIEKSPDIVLTYLTKESLSTRGKGVTTKVIEELKSIWPDVFIIAIVSNIQQREKARALGADEILFEGTQPARLLLEIEKVATANK